MKFDDGFSKVIIPWMRKILPLKNSDPSKVTDEIERLKEIIRKELRAFGPNDIIKGKATTQ